MDSRLKKLYSHFLKKGEQPKKNQKCKARLKNCSNCGQHFKKDETVCSGCKSPRGTCGKWAIEGKEVCVKHGGHAGRSMTKGVFITHATFTKAQWVQIEEAIKEKRREHEWVYQVATAAFKRIATETDNPCTVLAAASEYFSKIAKYMTDIDQVALDTHHTHSFNEVEKQ